MDGYVSIDRMALDPLGEIKVDRFSFLAVNTAIDLVVLNLI